MFRAVLNLNATEFHEAIPLHPSDVAGFVAAVYDHSVAHPEHLRMLTWARMEGIAYRLPEDRGATPERVAALREAQRLGYIDGSWDPDELLELLFGLAHAWVYSPIPPGNSHSDLASHRRAIVEAARRLLTNPAKS